MVALYGDRLQLIDPAGDPVAYALGIKSVLDDGGCLCFLGDRVQSRAGAGPRGMHEELFLGRAAPFVLAPFALAVRLKVPLHFFGCRKAGPKPDDAYEMVHRWLWDGAEGVTAPQLLQRYVRALEEQVRTEPQHWFNFLPFWQQARS